MRKLWLLLLVTGCTRPLPIGSSDCSSYTDAASCDADPGCTAFTCPSCNGSNSFAGCYDKNGPQPGIGCPAIACPQPCHNLDQAGCAAQASQGCHALNCCGSFTQCLGPNESGGCTCVGCSGLDEATCKARPDCRADYCPSCDPAHPGFGCSSASEPPPQCPAIPCPPPPECSKLTTELTCTQETQCHAVYEPGACGCAACCCTPFSRCATGGKADCKGPALCNSAPPPCANTACNPAFVVSYANGCYEGCVHQSECQ
jgi:hypothetical protein